MTLKELLKWLQLKIEAFTKKIVFFKKTWVNEGGGFQKSIAFKIKLVFSSSLIIRILVYIAYSNFYYYFL
jgi:hypothetical protein